MSTGEISKTECEKLFSSVSEMDAEEGLHIAHSLLLGLSPLSARINSYVHSDFISLIPNAHNKDEAVESWGKLISWVKENAMDIGEELTKVSLLFMAGPIGEAAGDLPAEVRFLVNDDDKTIPRFRSSSPEWKQFEFPQTVLQGKRAIGDAQIRIPKQLLSVIGAQEKEFRLERYGNAEKLKNACYRYGWSDSATPGSQEAKAQ